MICNIFIYKSSSFSLNCIDFKVNLNNKVFISCWFQSFNWIINFGGCCFAAFSRHQTSVLSTNSTMSGFGSSQAKLVDPLARRASVMSLGSSEEIHFPCLQTRILRFLCFVFCTIAVCIFPFIIWPALLDPIFFPRGR